jgi:signal transduction histidine kinase
MTPGQPPPDTLISVRPQPPSQGAVKLDLVRAGRRWVATLSTVLLLALAIWGGAVARWCGVGGLVAFLVFTQTGERIGLGPLFSSVYYFHGLLGPFSASAGALLVVATTALVGLVSTARRPVARRPTAVGVGILLALATPYLLWTLARGITPPATEVGVGLWLSWQLTFTVVGAALGLAAARLLAGEPASRLQPWLAVGGVLWAAVLGGLGLVLWRPTGSWPAVYGVLWLPAVLLVIQPARRAHLMVGITIVAGTAAALLTWGAVLHGTLGMAERDVRRLMGGDPVAMGFLDRFGTQLSVQPPPVSAAALYAAWRRSPLSQEDYPSALATWGPDGRRLASLELAELELRPALYAALAGAARDSARPVLRGVDLEPGVHYVTAVPYPDGTVVTVGVAPKSRIIRPVLVGRFLRGERRLLAPYELSLGELVTAEPEVGGVEWQRGGWTVRATLTLAVPAGRRNLHATVPLRDVSQLVVRALLFIVADLAFVALVFVVGAGLAGRLRVPAPLREIIGFRSYRIRLALVLAAFFVIPTLGFAGWSIGRIRADAARSRDLLIQQTLRDGVRTAQQFAGLPAPQIEARLRDLADRLAADFLWYRDGRLEGSSVPVLAELGLVGVYLPGDVYRELEAEETIEVTGDLVIGGQPTRVGYRVVAGSRTDAQVLAAPRLVDVSGLLREQEDLAFGLLLVTLLGLGGAAALAAYAARSLARPVQALRQAANAVGRGERLPPFGPDVPTEFVSVMDAFERMARDVEASQNALEAARRRTATVLSTVATGVLALDPRMHLTIANPKAEEVLGCSLEAGAHIGSVTDAVWSPVWEWVRGFLASVQVSDAQEFAIGERRIHVQVAVLVADPGGCVVALDDTTDLTRAVRVLAWGELARQIAHEIKNPLTPIRLGIQHLQRARRHGRADFDATLEQTSEQILAEIERLDAIARAFARFGAPPEEGLPVVAADLAELARDAAALYALSGEAQVVVDAEGPVQALVRPDEVKEVLVNLIENARDAGARTVTISTSAVEGGAVMEVRDDGRGITAEHMRHVFEPQFSTTSSGTGLGLAICKRLVESWGGRIVVESEVGVGTRVVMRVPSGGSTASP